MFHLNTKLMAATAVLLLVASFSWAQSPYWTGDGGRGMRLAVLEPTGNGLSTQEQWVLSQVQGSITADFNKFSAITIIDRQNLEKILAEQTQSLSGNYSEQDYVRLGNLTNARLILTGTIRKTANNYMLELAVTDAESGERRASYPPKAVSLIALENNVAAREATADILKQLGVNLTAAALQELKTVENNTAKIQAENALSRGITAQRQGTEVEALSYFFQAAAFDPTLTEATNRSSILAANISSGNIGEDARNEIQWRRNWITRLTETEQYFNNYFDNFFKTASMPYTLFYTIEIEQGAINFQNETLTLSIETNLHASSEWSGSVESMLRSMQSSIEAVQDGLTATGRAETWGLDKWPDQSNFNLKHFEEQNKNFTIIFELVNSKNQVIGRQTLHASGSYEIPAPLPGVGTYISVSEDDRKTVTFTNIKADDITDNLTIRIASVNGQNAEAAARNGVLQVTPLSADEWNSFHKPVYSITNNYTPPPRPNSDYYQPPRPKAPPTERETRSPKSPSTNNDYDFNMHEWPYFLVGYNYEYDLPGGFTIAMSPYIDGLLLYTSWNFGKNSNSNNMFEWVFGGYIPIIKKWLMIPIGIGGNHSHIVDEYYKELPDDWLGFYTDNDLETKKKEIWEHAFVMEIGLLFSSVIFDNVYLSSTYRLTNFTKNSFTIGTGFIF